MGDLMKARETENLTENSHHNGIKPSDYAKHSAVEDFFNILSTNFDTKGQEFVSSVEAKEYPFTGTQWHPEKNAYEWGGVGTMGETAIPHGDHATQVTQYMANNLVKRARRNFHAFASDDELESYLIYNFNPVHGISHSFEQ